MRSVQFRVSNQMYDRIEREAQRCGASLAQFARETTIARSAMLAVHRGDVWGHPDAWAEVVDACKYITEDAESS